MSENLQVTFDSDAFEEFAQCATLVDILRWRACHQPNRRAYTFLKDGEREEESMTYAQLDQQARRIAATLRKHAEVGARALLLYQPGLEYIAAFFGCLYAGVIAVPAYPPSSQRSLPRILTIATDAHALVALTSQAVLSKVDRWTVPFPETFRWIATDILEQENEESGEDYTPTAEMLAFLQYTSGSTGQPKGVMVSHGNLVHNAAMMRERWGCSAQSVGVSWLPIFHDMGLIAGVLLPLYTGFSAVLMAPAAFIQRPLRWLQAISQYQGTISYAPNFAYALCVRKLKEQELAQLDLRSWSVAVNGAEPVRIETLDLFAETFGSCGFRRETLLPGYGLAEGTLMVSCRPVQAGPKVVALDRVALEQHAAVPVLAETQAAQTLATCGPSAPDQRVAIVDPETLEECAQNQVGEIWISGPSVAQGYWQRPEETQQTFQAYLARRGAGPFLRTGDLGFIHEGEIVVTGRLKDVLIIRGRNHYPQDIELSVEQAHHSLKAGCGAAFSLEIAGEEHLVIVQELSREAKEHDLDEIFDAIHQAVWEGHELRALVLALIQQGSIPKTSSGKIQRRACRKQLLAGELKIIEVRFREQLPAVPGGGNAFPPLSREALLLVDAEQRRSFLLAYLSALLGATLDEEKRLSAYGLDSLKAADLKGKLEQDLGIDVALVSLLDTLSIRELLEQIATQLEATQPAPAGPQLTRRESQEVYPLSFSQEQLWFLSHLEPESAFYNVPVALHITGQLNLSMVRQSFAAVIQRHEALRTTFSVKDGDRVQRVHRAAPLKINVFDLQQLPGSEQRQLIVQQLIQQEIEQTFDLALDTLLRVSLLTLSEEEHILLVTIHHIVSDAFSVKCLLQEVMTCYRALQERTSAQLPSLPVQYGDYALWQRERFASASLAGQMSYWERRLRGLTTLAFPTDRRRPAAQSYRGATLRFAIPQWVKLRYQAVCNQEGTTLFMAFLTVFQILLAWYSGQEDIVVGTATANRSRAELQPLIGYFINMLVLRTTVSRQASFHEILQQVRATCLEAYGHQDVPFTKMVEHLRPQRDLSRNPLFQHCFSWRQDVLADLEVPGLALRQYEARTKTALFDLSIEIVDSKQGLAGLVEYSTDLFDAATIERLIAHFQHLLQVFLTYPDQKLALLSLLPPVEYQGIVEGWSRGQAWEAENAGDHVLQHFERQVGQFADRVAVAFEDEQLTYAQLDQRANQLAHYLRRTGVETETLVGVCMERSVELVVTLLAIWKAGGAYVPLDPSYPQERLAFMMKDACMDVLITQQRCMPLGAGVSAIGMVGIEAIWEGLARMPAFAPERLLLAENLAYVMYTSGSTGTPKGAMITHKGLLNYLLWAVDAYEVSSGHGAPLASSLSFDLSVTALFPPLLAGCAVRFLREDMGGGEALTETLNRPHHYSLVKLTPAHLEILNEQLIASQGADYTRCFVIGGEQLTYQTVDLWRTSASQTRLINEYGPTETVVGCCVYEVRPDDALEGAVPIGRPIANTHLYVLDEQMQPVPVGVGGELFIGGMGVARGYGGRPELTAQRFVPDPFAVVPGARLYRTGDLVRYRQDGTLELIGRVDRQVKLRGYRIELGEIEAVLRQQPGVRDATMLLRNESNGDQRLVAYLLSQPGGDLSVADLRVALKTQLPTYMLPGAFVILEQWPLTPNGKLDQEALAALEVEASGRAATSQGARTPAEELLVGIWAQVLGQRQESIGIYDNFFELGGHSLLATRVIARVRETFQVEISLRTLFEAPCVAELAQRLRHYQRQASHLLLAPPLVVQPREQALPLSFAQQRLWFLDQLVPNNSFYNIPLAWRLRGRLDLEALSRSVAQVYQRHEVLCTIFPARDGAPQQVIAPAPESVPIPVIDLRGIVGERLEEEADWLATREGHAPFNLACGPLLRLTVLRLADDEYSLLLTVHHIIADDWSCKILTEEISACYEACLDGRLPVLPKLPVQYTDYAIWQRQWLQGDVLKHQLAYWQEYLRDLPSLAFPTDFPRPAIQRFRGAYHYFALPGELVQQIKAVGQREGVTLFMILMAAFQVLLARYSGQEDIVASSGVANRTHNELEPLVGFFVNTLLLRLNLSGQPSFRDTLKRMREVCLEANAHQDVPFEHLVEILQPERDLSRQSLVQVMLVLLNAPTRALQLPDLQTFALMPARLATQLDMTLYLWEEANQLYGALVYDTDLFTASTMRRFTQHYQNMLQAMCGDIEQNIWHAPLLSEAEQVQQLVEWNATATPFPRDRCLHEIFEERVAARADAVAVVWEGLHLTYGQLDQQANQLARYLQRFGVAPDVVVGVCMERRPEFVIALLGILKAGGAYVPLDPNYPAERLAWLLQDARTPILLTQKHLLERLSTQPARVLALDAEAWDLQHESIVPPPRSTTPEHLAYVIYTSGSTGRPKGIAIRHRGVLNNLHDLNRRFAVGARDRVLALSSSSFDMCVYEVLGLLLAGGQVILPTVEASRDPAHWAQLVRQHQVTIWNSAPPLLELLLEYVTPEVELWPRSVRLVLLGGDWIAVTLPDRMRALAGDVQIIAMGGATESSIHSTLYAVDQSMALRSSIPYGRPMDNQLAYLLDTHGQLVPEGVIGELYLGGIGLARGYWQRPELTAERFLPHPFSSQPGARVYRTGDLARYLPDGTLELIGRVDRQVKLRGHRIELGEIEVALRQQPGVKEATVLLRNEPNGDQRLVAYLLSRSGGDLNVAQVRAALKAQLPVYMVPGAFVVLERWPLNPNGKLDRQALAALEIEESGQGATSQGARTPTEELLVGIWAQVLGQGQESIGIYDNFFELGGHSLLATQIISRLRAILQVEIPLRSLFEMPTIAELALCVEQFLRAEQALQIPPLLPVARATRTPLSFAQQRLWFLDQLEPGGVAYLVAWARRLCGQLHTQAFERSLQTLQRRHESLRTTFQLDDDQPAQVVHPAGRVLLPVVSLLGLDLAAREKEALRLAAQEAQAPCDLSVGPLWRVSLVRLAEHEHMLLTTMHHIIADGWSIGIFWRELFALYAAFAADEPVSLPALPVQYADFALWQRAWLRDEVLEQQLAYWKQQLTGAAPLEMPTDYARPAVQTFRGATSPFALPSTLSSQLKALGQQEGVTLFMTLLAALDVLLHYYTNQEDLIVGTDIANRNWAETEGLIGFFVNQLVLRTDLSGNPRFRDVLRSVRRVTLEAYAHQDVPFDRLIEELSPGRDLARTPLFQVKFVLQNAPMEEVALPDLGIEPVEFERGTAKFDLLLNMWEENGSIPGWVEYSTDLFNAESIARFLQLFEVVLNKIVAHPDGRLEELRRTLRDAIQQDNSKKLSRLRRKAK